MTVGQPHRPDSSKLRFTRVRASGTRKSERKKPSVSVSRLVMPAALPQNSITVVAANTTVSVITVLRNSSTGPSPQPGSIRATHEPRTHAATSRSIHDANIGSPFTTQRIMPPSISEQSSTSDSAAPTHSAFHDMRAR